MRIYTHNRAGILDVNYDIVGLYDIRLCKIFSDARVCMCVCEISKDLRKYYSCETILSSINQFTRVLFMNVIVSLKLHNILA